ncbi:putative LAG1 longevity assurance 2 [Paratrimastix pyriformis]|uniref:LAG1 longevity assurance 2 n=1 Tax=Paratrimastix pyriformis TaxID=342808 RepID=A0ABQ8UUX4_9EUKA|nr:putative LAG1 longevity assurance 2 [Paratrimastix pyriformis]
MSVLARVASLNYHALAIIFCLMSYFIRYCVEILLRRLGRTFIHSSSREKLEEQSTIFAKEGFKLLYHIAVTVLIWGYLFMLPSDVSWVRHMDRVWAGYPNQPLDDPLKIIYCLIYGRYWQLCTAHIIEKARLGRKRICSSTFFETLIHHLIALFLIGYSLDRRTFRVGILIMALHEMSPALMGTAQCFHYLGHEPLSIAFFSLMMISWFFLRLFYFPFFVIKSCMVDCYRVQGSSALSGKSWVLFNVLLVLLLLLHLYWFVQYVNVFKVAVHRYRARSLGSPVLGEGPPPSKESAAAPSPPAVIRRHRGNRSPEGRATQALAISTPYE